MPVHSIVYLFPFFLSSCSHYFVHKRKLGKFFSLRKAFRFLRFIRSRQYYCFFGIFFSRLISGESFVFLHWKNLFFLRFLRQQKYIKAQRRKKNFVFSATNKNWEVLIQDNFFPCFHSSYFCFAFLSFFEFNLF